MALTVGDAPGTGTARDPFSNLSQQTRLHYDKIAQTYFGIGLDEMISAIGGTRSMETLGAISSGGVTKDVYDILSVGGIKSEKVFIPFKDPSGKAGGKSPIDDLIGGGDEMAAKLFAQADAKARAAQAKAQAEADRNLREHLKWEMRYGSFAMPFDVTKHINAVVKRHGSMPMLLNMIYADKRFKKTFPGILDKNGDLKMSVGEYNQTRDFARSEFAKSGIKLSDEQFGSLMGKNVRPEGIAERAKIGAFIKGNADVLISVKAQVAEMNKARKAKGLPPLQGLDSMADLAKYVTRQGDAELYSSYEGGVIAAMAKRAGLDVAGSRARQLGAAAVGLEDPEEAEQKFKQVADRLRVAGVELGSVGLTQADLETIEFGGTNRALLAQQAEQVLLNRQAEVEQAPAAENLTLNQGRPVSTSPARQAGL